MRLTVPREGIARKKMVALKCVWRDADEEYTAGKRLRFAPKEAL